LRSIRRFQSHAPISPRHHGAGVQYGWIKKYQPIVDQAMNLAESSVRLDPRSSFAFADFGPLRASMDGNYEAAMEAAKAGGQVETRTTWVPRRTLNSSPRESASIGRPVELFSAPCSAAAATPDINGRR